MYRYEGAARVTMCINREQMLTTELVCYRDVNIRGVVNDTTRHAQKRDVRVVNDTTRHAQKRDVRVTSIMIILILPASFLITYDRHQNSHITMVTCHLGFAIFVSVQVL